MNRKFKNFAMVVIVVALSTGMWACCEARSTGNSSDTKEIKALIKTYGRVLNDSNVVGVTALFTDDGVFMPAKLPTAVGHKQIKAAFEHEFKMIDLDTVIVFDEVVQEGNLAFVRSRSKGTITILAKKLIINGRLRGSCLTSQVDNIVYKI